METILLFCRQSSIVKFVNEYNEYIHDYNFWENFFIFKIIQSKNSCSRLNLDWVNPTEGFKF